MPKLTDVQEAAIRRHIRDARALDPLISLVGLQKVLETKFNRQISVNFIMKLSKKVDGEIMVRPDIEKIEHRVAQMRENNRIVREGLLKIAYPGQSVRVADKDKIRALETIARIDHSMAKIEMDFGIYTRKIGEIDINHKNGMDSEKLQSIVKAFENWGISPPQMRKIDPERIVNVKSTKVTNDTPNQPTTPPASSNIIPAVGSGLVTTE